MVDSLTVGGFYKPLPLCHGWLETLLDVVDPLILLQKEAQNLGGFQEPAH